MQSNVLTHDDENLRNERNAMYDMESNTRIGMASNAGWAN
jgi:hypothetical protein